MKNPLTAILLVFIISPLVWGQTNQSSFFLSPGVAVPTGPSVEGIQGAPYSAGFKLDGRATIPLGDFPLALHTQAGLNLAPLSGSSASDTLTLLSLQAGPAFTMNLTDSLAVGAALQGGGYLGMIQGANGANGVFSARADVNLSLNSNFTVGVGGDYSYYLAGGSSSLDHTWSGLGINLNLRYLPGQSRERESRLEIQEIIIFPVYPVLHSYYNTNGIGEVTVKNNEPGTIENVAVTFYVPKYMSGPQTFQTGETLKRGETITLPIYGLLESSILEETEGTLVQAQVSVSYDLRSTSLTAAEGAKADILYRNALSWDDDRRAASFVTAKEPGLIEFAKNTTSSLRSRINREIDPALTGAMAMFEALSLYGIKYQVDPDSSYKDLSGQEEILDYLQFPIETLNYKSGDCDDMSVLYTAMLESLAIKTAFITVPGHIFTAVALEISPEEAQKTFVDPQALIYQDDRAWVPVETTMIDGSDFLAAWREGSRQWREARERDQARLYPVEQAWALYPPVALNAYRDKSLIMPDMNILAKNYGAGESTLIEQETAAQTAFLEKAIRESRGERRYRMINSLAVLKARYGQFDEAIDLLEAVVAPDIAYAPGATNLANIYYRRGDMDKALTYYNMALNSGEAQPKAVLGIMLVSQETGNYRQVQSSYEELVKIAPVIAEKYAYLATGSGDVKRASEAGRKERVLWDED